ncbi:MAG TPA: hypothetical protein VN673_05340, partial [Clostridia bacterium]|nr:hypothetical protein [Clostridia bacterium]
RVFFPSPEKVVRKQLLEVAQLASFGPNESPLAALSNTEAFLAHFDSDIVILVDLPSRSQHRLRGREELMFAIRGSRQALSSLAVEFVDIDIKLGPDQKVAVAAVTVRARASGERDDLIQELQFTLRKIDGRWLIIRAETVKTLSEACLLVP